MTTSTSRLALALAALLATAAQAQVPADPFNYNRTSSFTYRADGLLESETIEPDATNSALCVKTVHHYDGFGNKDSLSTGNCAGSVPARQQFATRTSSTSYSAQTMPTISINGTTVTLQPGAFALTAANAEGHSESRLYDPRFGAATQLTGPNGLSTTWTLDDFGRKVRETQPDGTSVVTAYCFLASKVGDVSSNSPDCPTPAAAEIPADAVSFTHSESRSTANAKMGPYSRVYSDRLGRAIRTATEGFDGASQPAALAGAAIVSDAVYNTYGAKVLETRPYYLGTGSSTTTGSNDRGATRTDYDVLGRPVAIHSIDPEGSQAGVDFGAYGSRRAARTTIAYDGLTITTYNDKGQARREEKNANGQVVRITDNAGARLVHQHDAFGNLIRTVDALGNRIAIQYDLRGRKVELDDPDAGLTRYEHNPVGELVWQQSANQRAAGTQTTQRYDRLGRLIERAEPEYTSTWKYDTYADGSACTKGIGKLCDSSTTNGLNRRIVYDALGRPQNTRTTVSNGPSFATALAYETGTGRVAAQIYPTGLQVNYGYTGLGFQERMWLGIAATVTPLPATPGGTPAPGANFSPGAVLWQARVVNAWGKAEQYSTSNGVNTRATFDPATGRTASLTAGLSTATNVLNHGYVWDSLNNLQQRNDANGDAVAGAVTENFRYEDGLNRLTGYTVSAPAIPGTSRSVTLQYNVLGQLLYKSDVGVYGYGSAGPGAVRPHALQSVTDAAGATTGYSYDANGNLTAASAGKYRSITYTSFNLPDGNSGAAGPGNSPRYTWQYDESHARVKETRVDGTGTRTTWYLHPDNAGGLGFESETGPNGAVSNRHYLSAGGQAIGVLMSTAALPTLGSGQTAPPAIGSIALVKMEYWHKDHLGSLVATTDHAGNVTARYAYDPFGKRRFTNGSYDGLGSVAGDWRSAVNWGTDRGFTGHEHLDDQGLVHMNGRIFDPTLGVFLQADPLIQDPNDLQNYNRYGYCLNNPLTCTDPTGYSWLSKTWKKVWHNKAFRVVVAVAVSVVSYGYGSELAATWLAGTSTAATAGFSAATINAVAAVGGGLAAGFSGTLVATGGDFGAAVKGGVLGGLSAGIGSVFGGADALGRMMGGGVNGYLQTGKLSGFARGFAAAAVPNDMWIGDLYRSDPYVNVGASILRDGLRGAIVRDSWRGFASEVAYGQASNFVGHSIGIISTSSLPRFRDGAFFYEGDMYGTVQQGGALTLGNVISGPVGLADEIGSDLYLHERDHFENPVEQSLGALYIPAHVFDLALGHTLRYFGGGCSGFFIEEHTQKLPYSQINLGLCQKQ